MAIQDDFSINANGDIRYVGTTTNYTVIALHRWLGDFIEAKSELCHYICFDFLRNPDSIRVEVVSVCRTDDFISDPHRLTSARQGG